MIMTICKADDTAIYFKKDGGRFEKDTTLKMQVDTEYYFTLNIKPSVSLQSVSMQGIGLTISDDSNQDNNNGGSRYSFNYQTLKTDPNKNKARTKLLLIMQFQDGVTMSVPLQAKFYNQNENQHINWGNQLTQIEFECEVKSGHTFVDIHKESYF